MLRTGARSRAPVVADLSRPAPRPLERTPATRGSRSVRLAFEEHLRPVTRPDQSRRRPPAGRERRGASPSAGHRGTRRRGARRLGTAARRWCRRRPTQNRTEGCL
eukprot:Amastigsp_a179403_21.p2 type:complete len:105 gc:universal Amastigsp_a179403_21:764-450(-)